MAFQLVAGIAFAQDGTLLVTDSANDRIVRLRDDDADTLAVKDTFGVAGTALGQFQLPLNAGGDLDAFYVADTGNNRIQKIDAREQGFHNGFFHRSSHLASQPESPLQTIQFKRAFTWRTQAITES